jgi:EpsI family protein
MRSFPQQIGDWKGKDLTVTEDEYQILETRNLIVREYTNSSGQKIGLFIIYSETNRSVFHPPEVCFLGSGIKIADKSVEQINAGKLNFSANKMYAEKNNFRELVLYCYSADKFYTANFYLQQAIFTWNQLFAKNRGGATIRVSMAMGKNEEQALASLKQFLVEVVEIMEKIS